MGRKASSIIKIALSLFIIVAIERFCHKQTDGFRLHKIASSLPYNPKWEVSSLTQEEASHVNHVLGQRYYFLASGGQSYAFLSEDGTTVLKVFKQHHLRSWKWLKKLPLPKELDHIRKKFLHKRKQKQRDFFQSCKIAFDDFRDRTGLLYMHLNKTSHLNKRLTIIDKIGIAHEIDLDATEFALQKKAELAYPKLLRLAQEKDKETAQECLGSLLELILERSKKGIVDKDPNIRRNIGFIGTKAVEVDLGSFGKDKFLQRPYATKTEFYYQTLKLKEWVAIHTPKHSSFLKKRIEAILQQNDTSLPNN